MEKHAALGEEGLEVTVLDEGDHEEKESNNEEQQPRKRIRGLDQKLIMRRRSLELRRRLTAMPEDGDLVEVEHHQSPTSHRNRRVKHTDQKETGRRGGGRAGHENW